MTPPPPIDPTIPPSSSKVFAPALKARRAAQGLVGAANQRQMNAGFPVLTLLRFNLQGPQSLPVAAVKHESSILAFNFKDRLSRFDSLSLC